MAQHLVPLGLFVILVGFMILIIGILAMGSKADSRFAIGGFIGFIPFGFGNNRQMVWIAIVISLALLILFIAAHSILRT